jgi:DNA replication and repair protein RecF
MKFRTLAVEGFRNFQRLEADFSGGNHFICGDNGQGKTNLLEALGLVTALRSFRIADPVHFISWQAPGREARLCFRIEHEQMGESELELWFGRGGKRILLDGEPVRKMGDFVGLFPTVAFSSQDIQILRGAPGLRRRWLDMMLVDMEGDYYRALSAYHQALKARNALLKDGAGASARRPFEQLLIETGWQLTHMRQRLVAEFCPLFRVAYRRIANVEESPELAYQAHLPAADEAAYREQFMLRGQRDMEQRTTRNGPHRDELQFTLLGHPAREFASEGQQRALVLAMQLAHVQWFKERGMVQPVILADDIVGELDKGRRAAFWHSLEEGIQVFATGTALPADGIDGWARWRMRSGSLLAEAEA